MQAFVICAILLVVSSVAYCVGDNADTNQDLGVFTPAANVVWRHATPENIDAKFGEIKTGKVDRRVQYTYWFIGGKKANLDEASINVHSWVDDPDADGFNQVRFDVHWEQFPSHPSRSWLLPLEANGTLYRDSNKTLCSNINQTSIDLSDVTVKVIVTTQSDRPLNFSLSVFFGQSNLINLNETREFNQILFSPSYYKLKINSSTASASSRYALLEITSKDDICITVALEPPQCPLLDKERDAILGRHLTMSRTASMTIEMDDLVEGRFLVFIMHQNDSKCNSNGCAGCWNGNDEILPLDLHERSDGNQRQKQLFFRLREKISDKQYIFSTSASIGLYFSIFLVILFFVIYYTFKSVQLRRASSENVIAGSSGSGNHVGENEQVVVTFRENDRLLSINSTNEPIVITYDYLFGCIRRKHGVPCCTDTNRITHGAKKRSGQRYFGTLLVNAIFYILPAVQLIWIYQRVYTLTGNEDMCYYNFKCLHPLFGIAAFNHLFSNVGYVMLGLLFVLVVKFDTTDRPSSGIYMAMGIALVIQGVMSALYHTCPNHISFQFDTCFMYITAMLCWVIVFQAQHPDTNTSAILTHAIVAIAVTLGVAAVVTKAWYFWICITAMHLFVCFIFSFHLDSIRGKYTWNFVWPWRIDNRQEVISSFLRPIRRWNFQKVFLVLYNVLNWVVAGVGLWSNQKSQDFASYLLILFIANLSIFSVTFLWVKLKERKVSWQTWAYLGTAISMWSVSFYFYLSETASWGVSPAESRILNKDCILFEFFDHHDIWHFLSAFGMFLNFMFFFTLDDVTPPPCQQPILVVTSSTTDDDDDDDNIVSHTLGQHEQETVKGTTEDGSSDSD